MEIQLKVIGILLMLLAVIHTIFPKYFNWKKEFEGVSLINKQMMYVHTFFIGVTVFLMGLLSFNMSGELYSTPFGKVISLGIGFFWFLRLIFQFLVYSPKLWRGKKFETFMHILFSLLWIYVTTIFLWIGFSK